MSSALPPLQTQRPGRFRSMIARLRNSRMRTPVKPNSVKRFRFSKSVCSFAPLNRPLLFRPPVPSRALPARKRWLFALQSGRGIVVWQDGIVVFRARSGGELQRRETRVERAARDELRMPPLLDDAPAVEHKDAVGTLDRGEPVRDYYGCAPAHRRLESVLDNALTLRIQTAGRFAHPRPRRARPHSRRRS